MRVMPCWISTHGGKRMVDDMTLYIEYYNEIRYLMYINQDELVVMVDDD